MTSSWLATASKQYRCKEFDAATIIHFYISVYCAYFNQHKLYVSGYLSNLQASVEVTVSARYDLSIWALNVGDNDRGLKEQNVGKVLRRKLRKSTVGKDRYSGVGRQAANRAPLPVIWTVSQTQQLADVWKVAAVVNDAMEKPAGPQRRPGSAAGRAVKWKEPTKRQLLRMPNVPRTKVYTVLSLFLLVCLSIVLFYDFIQMVAVQHPNATTQHFTVAILVSIDNCRWCVGLLGYVHYYKHLQYTR